jgi:hypothetical protein
MTAKASALRRKFLITMLLIASIVGSLQDRLCKNGDTPAESI